MIESAKLAVFKAMDSLVGPHDAPEPYYFAAADLVNSIESLGHTHFAARWAVHDLIRECMLSVHVRLVRFGEVVIAGQTRATHYQGSPVQPVELPKDGPVPYDKFVVKAEASLWESWEKKKARQVRRSGTKARGNAKPKKASETETKIIAALTKWHKYSDGSCLRVEPAPVRELAILADVGVGSVSRFFAKQFSDNAKSKSGESAAHSEYARLCRDLSMLIAYLQVLNRERLGERVLGDKSNDVPDK